MNVNSTNEKSSLKIKIEQPATFSSCADVTYATSADIADAINEMFRPVFSDYKGCNIMVTAVPGRGYVVTPILYFALKSESEYINNPDNTYAFKPIMRNAGDDIVQRRSKIAAISTGLLSTKIEMTADAKSVLADFVLGDFKDETKIPWTSDYYKPYTTNMETYIMVTKLDMVKFVSKAYGEVGANGDKMYYQIAPLSPAANSYGRAENWIFYIFRLHDEIYDKLKLKGYNINPSDASPVMFPAG